MELEAVKIALRGPVADVILAAWRLRAAEHEATGAYMAMLTRDQAVVYPAGGNELSLAVVNRAPYARVLEEGHAGFHLPSVIHWPTERTKVTKDGRYYLTIPFRHFTPGGAAGGLTTRREKAMMPPEVYHVAKMLVQSRDLALSNKLPLQRLAGFGGQITRHYGLMEQQIPGFPKGLKARAIAQEGQPGYTWRAGRYEGMRRSFQPNESGVVQSTYMTFRTLTSDSVGWYIPPVAGFHLAAETVREVGPEIARIISDAARAEITSELKVIFGEGT